MFLHYNNQFILQSCMSTVGLGGSILFRQLLPFPVYANVCHSLIGLRGGGIVMASQHGFKFTGISPSEFPIMIIPNPNGVYKLVVIVQFINCVNIPVYKLHHHHQLINGSYLGDDNLVKIG